MLAYFIIMAIVTALVVFLVLPALTISSIALWVLGVVVLGIVAAGLFLGQKEKAGNVFLICMLILAAIMLIAAIVASPLFMSHSYASILGTPEKTDIEEYTPSIETVPLMDRGTAELLMNRTLGTLVDEVSQFELGDSTQINFQGRAIRVAPLDYAGPVKWLNNRHSGIPAYVTVDMQTQKTDIHYLDEGMKYSPSAFLGKDLMRHVWLSYPTVIMGSPVFELDEEGNPLWVIPRYEHKVGLFSGKEVQGVFCVNAVTGAIDYYRVGDIPNYIDNVYPASLIIEQYDNYGKYTQGFWNSLVGQRSVTATTEGYNYIPQGDDIYLYTGVTSVGGDESNIGFIYVNLRTKEAKYFEQAGAEEYSAMASAEGMVQHLGYESTFPLLLNIESQPTYCMALKDAGGLVKMYGLVNVEQYQIVVTADSISQCLQKYRASLRGNGQTLTGGGKCISGIITDIRTANMEGTTFFYVQLNGKSPYYELSAADNKQAILLNVGDRVSLSPAGQLMDSIQEAVMPVQKIKQAATPLMEDNEIAT